MEQKGKATGTKGTVAHRETHCEGETGRGEKKKQRPSSEMLKRKRTKGSGSQALIPEEKSKREAPVEQLWERSWEGRKETNRKPSTGTVSKAWETRPGRTGRTVKARAEAAHWGSHCEAELGSAERKNSRLSSEMLRWKRTKGSGSQAPIPEERSKREAPVERLWERSREGRKETNRELSMQT